MSVARRCFVFESMMAQFGELIINVQKLLHSVCRTRHIIVIFDSASSTVFMMMMMKMISD